MLSKLMILLTHLIVAIFLAYLSYMVLTKKPIPMLVGVVLGLLSLLVVVAHLYFFTHSNEKYCGSSASERHLDKKREERRHRPSVDEVISARGLSYDANDPDYAPIGGVGGLGFL